jgi:hypothetical protein
MNYEQAIKELQDNLIVISEIERRQSALLREHSQIMVDHDRVMVEHDKHLGEMAEFRRRTEQNLSEITDKLNGLIGYMDGLRPPMQ